ncbi:DUF4430 domain-containing protein [Bacillus sp. ISL-18]|uniref:DUF4430 domain-containing protein n=1 Tax=Bacillus sp. ISL-18 TaxID=2819118 RepID=UPI001BED1ECE|nr:DUF4430 domain-containing protein [Bacillus sp. ISL-18]MBT2658209.1 DUF4430 domain-containing protein [Bacillus sp. ISL-18]
MKRRFNFAVLFAFLVVILSLTGCGSSTASNQETQKETKTVAVTAKADNKTEQDSKQQNAVDQTKSSAAPAVKEEKQQAASKPAPQTESRQSAQPVQKSSAQAEPTTPATTSKKSITSTAKPAGTTASTTTTPAAKATTSTAAKTTTTPQTTTTAPVVKPAVPAPKPVTTVTLSIVGPKDKGTILAPTKVKINDGNTIFDVLKRTNIDIDSSGSGATAYIEGINNIYEFDYGAKSGWVFKLNGASITKSIGVIKVKAGDRIECYYTE